MTGSRTSIPRPAARFGNSARNEAACSGRPSWCTTLGLIESTAVSQPAFDFEEEELDDPTNPTYSVGELADAINDSLRRGFRDGVWVRGEISGWSDRGAHAYFSLADEDERGRGKSVLNVQFFAPSRMKLRPVLQKNNLRLADGMKVRIFGHLDYYAPTGRIGLKMAGIDPRYTLGDIAQSRDEVIRRLVAEGLLDANKRHRLSPVPLRVGVVTSIGTAAWHDFHDEIERSGLGFRLSVVDTRVQGEFAENMITAAIARLAMRPNLDVIAVIRGGGARNELAVFDAEKIARMIASSPIPVMTGLGHEVDRSVADDVAHTALKTPTACAGALVNRVMQYTADAEQAWASIRQCSGVALTQAANDISDTAHRIARRTHAAVERSDERLNVRVERLARNAPAVLTQASEQLDRTAARLQDRPIQLLQQASQRLDLNAARTSALDPVVQLARGWTITRNSSGAVVRSTADVAATDVLTTELLDGSFTSVVDSVDTHDAVPATDQKD